MKKILGIVIGILIVTAGFLWVNAQITGGVCDAQGNCSVSSKRNNPFSNFGPKKTAASVLEFPKFTHSMYEEDVKNGKKKIYFIAFIARPDEQRCAGCEAAKSEGELLDQLTQYYKDDPSVGVYVTYYKDAPMTNGRYVYSQYVQENPTSQFALLKKTPIFAWAMANGDKRFGTFSVISEEGYYQGDADRGAKADVIGIIESLKKAAFSSKNSNNTR